LDALGEIEAPIFQTAAFGYASAEEMADVFAGVRQAMSTRDCPTQPPWRWNAA